ncbi:MAG: hypothetical protein ACK4MW_02645 [Aquificaceae bacterium]
MVVWIIAILLLFIKAYALDCSLLQVRYLALKEEAIYEDLMKEVDTLIKKACETKDQKTMKAADKLLQALETIKSPETFGKDRVIANRRIRKASILLGETKKYSKDYPQIFFYQLLFYQVAQENYRVGDYEYALKYSLASYNLGRAILELR